LTCDHPHNFIPALCKKPHNSDVVPHNLLFF
jgi:hypothetical protein